MQFAFDRLSYFEQGVLQGQYGKVGHGCDTLYGPKITASVTFTLFIYLNKPFLIRPSNLREGVSSCVTCERLVLRRR